MIILSQSARLKSLLRQEARLPRRGASRNGLIVSAENSFSVNY